jgi:hypothetical protein
MSVVVISCSAADDEQAASSDTYPMQRPEWGRQVDHRFAKDAAGRIRLQSATTIPVEKRQAEFTGMVVDGALTCARGFPFAHQGWHA